MDSHAEGDVTNAERTTQSDPEGMGCYLQFVIEEPGV